MMLEVPIWICLFIRVAVSVDGSCVFVLEEHFIGFEFYQYKFSLALIHIIFIYAFLLQQLQAEAFEQQTKKMFFQGFERYFCLSIPQYSTKMLKSSIKPLFGMSMFHLQSSIFIVSFVGGQRLVVVKVEIPIFILSDLPAIIQINISLLSQMDFQLDSIIEVLLSNDNKRRIEAERFIDQVPVNAFEAGIDAFLASMSHENSNVASMGALLLKKKYLDPKTNIERIPQEKLVAIVGSVKNCMNAARPVMFLKRCCEILVRVYSFANIRDELVGVIEQLNCVPETNMKLALMYFIQIVCESAFNDQLLLKYSNNLEAIFQGGLEDPANEVKVAAFKTLTIFLASINDEKAVRKFAGVLKVLVSKTIELIKYDQESGMVALESLNELVEAQGKFIKPIFDNLLMIYAEIMEAAGLLVGLRSTALAGVLILCNQHHTLVRKSNYFRTKMVPSYMAMLAEINETGLEEWAEELIDEVISKNDIAMSTEEHLAQVTNQLGNKFMLPLFVPYITSSLASGEMRYQHAGLTALALLVENCHQSFKGELKNMVALMMPLLNSQHPRIIYDVLIAMGYMASEFAPEIQINFGSVMLEFISKALCHPLPKVQYKAALCIVNFEQGIAESPEVTVMQPFLQGILGRLAAIFEGALQKANYIMLEGVLESLASIAASNNFTGYYSRFMPGLVKLVGMLGSDTPQKVNIKSKAIETMGDLLTSIKDNRELFLPECQSIMTSLISLQGQLDKEDTLHRAIFTAYEDIVSVLKEEFAVFSDSIFPLVYEAAARRIDVQIIDEMETAKQQQTSGHKYVKVKLDLKLDGVKNIVLNTDTFEQKVQATSLLAAMAQDMGAAFLKYADHMYPLIEELILIKNSKEMRSNMVDACKGMLQGAPTPQMKNALLVRLFPQLKRALAEAIRAKDHSEAASITEVCSIAMPFMSPEMFSALPEMMMAVLGLVKNLSNEIEKIYAEKDMDDDLTEEMNNETDEVEEPLEFVEAIMKQAKGIKEFDNLRQFFPKDYEFDQEQ